MSDFNPSSMLSVGTVLKDTYRIEGFLSSGGFGNTYVATNLTFNEKVAVKEFFLRDINQRDDASTVSVSNPDNRALFDELLEKFRKEAQRIRRLRSPHVVRVHDLFDANGTAYYVMDYIDGESLAARLRRTQQPLGESEAMRYFGQVLDALEAIHAAGLCHMDLKPDNVMVDKADNAVLIDFGASKRIASDQLTSTVTGVSYTNGYAPPEQLELDTDNFGPWTDIYALGATLYKLLTNRKPPMPSAIYSDPTLDKSRSLKFPEGVSEQARQLVRRLMTVVWHERPQSVSDVRKIMGQVEQRTVGNHPQKTTSIQGTTAGYDDPTMIKNKLEENTEEDLHYEIQKSSYTRKWSYAVIGVLLFAIVGVVYTLYKNDEGQDILISDLKKEQRDSIEKVGKESLVQTIVDSVNTAVESVAEQLNNAKWYNTDYGFKIPDIMTPSEEMAEYGSVYRWDYDNVCLVHWPIIGAWAVIDYPAIDSYLTATIKVKSVTYINSKRTIFSGYADDGRVWYMKKRILDGRDVDHVSSLILLFPKSLETDVMRLIEVVKGW